MIMATNPSDSSRFAQEIEKKIAAAKAELAIGMAMYQEEKTAYAEEIKSVKKTIASVDRLIKKIKKRQANARQVPTTQKEAHPESLAAFPPNEADGPEGLPENQKSFADFWLNEEYQKLAKDAKSGDENAYKILIQYVFAITRDCIKFMDISEVNLRRNGKYDPTIFKIIDAPRHSLDRLYQILDQRELMKKAKNQKLPRGVTMRGKKLPEKEYIPSNLEAFAGECSEIAEVFTSIQQDLGDLFISSHVNPYKIQINLLSSSLSDTLDSIVEECHAVSGKVGTRDNGSQVPAYKKAKETVRRGANVRRIDG